MSIKDVTAVIDAKAIKRYCDSKKVNGKCSDDCVFRDNIYCMLPDILGSHGEESYIDAKQKIREKISELSK